MEIHQIVVGASPADAVTNDALAIQELLRKVGPSEIFARYVHDELAGEVHRLEDYEALPSARTGANLLIYHASIGEPVVVSFLLGRREQLVLKYHNITPPGYFLDVDPAFAELLAGGRLELAALQKRVLLALADSAYNAGELEELGYQDVRVSPLLVETSRLLDLEPDPILAQRLDETLGGPLLLFVGQLLPHKRPDLMLQAYHLLVTYLMPEAHLALVGPWPSDRYRWALEAFVRQLNLDRALLPGRVPAAELAAYFRKAAAFVTMSEHEGVCVPLLEAMAFDLPVVARDYAAVPETLSGAGLLLPAEDDPMLVAEALARVLTDEELRRELVAAGARRLADFDPDAARATLLGHIADVA
ncbi:MAG TPA: glycosyltransferase [Acidimicrobiia bacterium]